MINAAYLTWEQSIEEFGFIVGVRAEQVKYKGSIPTIDTSFSNRYLKIYPTIHLKYELSKIELGFSYSRRANRPDGDELNPFPEYDDPLNFHSGNPKLLPEYIHSLELAAEMKKKNISFIPTLYYRYTYNGFTTVTKQLNDSVIMTTEENLSNSQVTGLEMIFSGKISSWLNGNLSGNIFQQQIDASNLGYSNNKSIITFSNNLNLNFTIRKNYMFQLGGYYRSAELSPQGLFAPIYSMNLGAKKEFFKNKLAIVVTLNDALYTYRRKSNLDSKELIQRRINTRDSRMIYVGIKYRFGSSTKKSKSEGVQFDDSEK